jgi:hypothetical protein
LLPGDAVARQPRGNSSKVTQLSFQKLRLRLKYGAHNY